MQLQNTKGEIDGKGKDGLRQPSKNGTFPEEWPHCHS